MWLYRTFFNPVESLNLSFYDISFLILTGIFSSAQMLFFIRASQLEKAGRGAGLNFLSIILGYLSDLLFFGYSMSISEIIGALVIVGCSIMIFVLKIYKYSD
jgi:uncharacterized membrane protein